MSDLAAPFRQLVERRLWPLALLLLAAAAAVPLLLAKGEEPAPPAPAAATASTTAAQAALATQPIVSVGGAEARERRRKVLGSAKNPFKPARLPKKPKVSATTATAPAGSSAQESVSKTAENLSDAIKDIVGGSSPIVTPVAPLKRTFELYSLQVRFGDSAQPKLASRNLKRLKALPNAEEPVVIYLGLLDDYETAVFLVDANARPQGDGRCMPSVANCQTVHMKVGDIEFFDVVDAEGQVVAQYQLDLVKIRKRRTTDAQAARRARAAVARGGREALRPRVGRASGLHYDSGSGTVRRK